MNLQIIKTDLKKISHSRYELSKKTKNRQRWLDTYVPRCKRLILGMAIPPLKGNPYNRYIKPYCVDDHPLPQETNWEFRPQAYYEHIWHHRHPAAVQEIFCLCFQSSFSSEIAGIRYHDLALLWREPWVILVTLDLTAFFRWHWTNGVGLLIRVTQWNQNWLVVSTHLTNNIQIGSLPQIGVNINNIWNHQLENNDQQTTISNSFFTETWLLLRSHFSKTKNPKTNLIWRCLALYQIIILQPG